MPTPKKHQRCCPPRTLKFSSATPRTTSKFGELLMTGT